MRHDEFYRVICRIETESCLCIVPQDVCRICVLLRLLERHENVSVRRYAHSCTEETLVDRLVQIFVYSEHFACRLHFRSESDVHICQLRTREHRNLYGVLFSLFVKACAVFAVSELMAQHSCNCKLYHRNSRHLAQDRHCTRRSRIHFYDVYLLSVICILDVHKTDHV